MITCSRCKIEFHDENIDLAHLIPKQIGGKDSDGRRYLCRTCHMKLDLSIPKQIFKFVPKKDEEKCKQAIKKYSLWFIEQTK